MNTFEQVLEKIKQLDFRWKINNAGCLRTMLLIPEWTDHGSNGQAVCPLTALCYHRSGKYYFVDQALEAAEHIGIPKEVAERIINAADSAYTLEPDVIALKLATLVDMSQYE